MKIQIQDNLYLESDERQYVIKEYTGKVSVDKKTGKESDIYNTLGYYPTLTSALRALMNRKIKESNAQDIKELLADIKRIEGEIDDLFSAEIDGERKAV